MNQKANSIADMAASLLRFDHRWRREDRKVKRLQVIEEREEDRRHRMIKLQAEVDVLKEQTSRPTLPPADTDALRTTMEELADDLQALQDEAAAEKVGTPPMTTYDEKAPRIPKFARNLNGTMIRWANVLDAEYAETWPKEVVHATLLKSRYTAAFPAMDLSEPDLVDDASFEEIDASVADESTGGAASTSKMEQQ